MSATDRVGIEIQLMGYEQAMNQMQNLDGMVKGLSGRKGYLKIKAELDKVNMNKRALRANKVKLQADMSDVDKAIRRTKAEAESLRRVLRGKGGLYNPSDARNFFRLRREMSELGKQRMGIADELHRTNAEIQQSVSYAERLRAALNNAGNSSRSLGQIFSGISSRFAHIGSAMQSLGNSITRLMTPLRMITSGALIGMGYKAMHTVYEGLSSGFKRYDIMHKYPRMMKQFETANYSAEKSIKDLEQSVLGLPTGLDEMVNLSQRFTMTIGDMEKGTKLAIATNNAFLASMSTETQKYQGMMQLQDVLGGKKMNAREWQALANAMMPAIRMMGEDLGKSGKELKQWVADVQQGKIANEDFLDALIKTGTGAGKAAKMAEESKNTWEAFASNTRIAFSRLTVGVIESLDKIVSAATGGDIKSVNQLLTKTIIPGIDGMTKSAKKWIKSHPEEITNFFNDLKSIDWKGLGTGIVKGVGELVKGIQSIAKWLGGRSLEGVGKWIVRLNVLGNGLLIFGGMIKGLRGVFAGVGTIGVGFSRLLGGLGIAGAASGILKFINFFKNFGKVGRAAEAVGGASKVAKFGSTFKAFIPAIEAIAGIGAITTELSLIAAIDTGLLSLAMGNVKTITKDMGEVFDNVKGLKSQGFDANGLREAVNNIFSIYDIIYGEKTSERVVGKNIMTTRKKEGLASFKKGALKDIADSMKSMSSIFGSMTQIQTNLKNLKGFEGFDEKAIEGVKNFASALGGVYDAFETAFSDETAIDPEQAQGFADIVESTKSMFGSLNKAMKIIPKLLSSVGIATTAPNGGMGESPLASLKKMLIGEDTTGGLFKDLGDIFSKLRDNFQKIDAGGLSTQMSSVFKAIRSIRKIGNQLSKMGEAGTLDSSGVDTAIANIKSFISKLSTALDTTVVGDIQNKVGALRTTINGIFQALNTDLSNVEVTVNIKGEVKGADDLVSKINKAHTQITNAVRKIPSTITKTVTVNINGKVNNNLPSIPSLDHPPHTGGYITGKHSRPLYRAKGGIINPFRPKGTDTVPTVLTPGEYVMKRSAVDAFGVRFMQRINNMDIRGAMRELSSRAGRIASVNRGTTNYITNNNNQQVTQHINTSNPNFAYKRSNRYVMAL